MAATDSQRSTARQRRLVLGVVGLALVMVVSAVSGLNVALPDVARETGATQTQLQWIVDAYSIVFAALLLPAGSLGDRFGRKGALLVGLVIFGVGAAGAVVATDPGLLIALRAVMGVGAAFVMPSTLSIITTSFPEEERGQAVGVWVGLAGAGAVLGLFATGILLEYFEWNSFFVLNVVLAVLALIGTVAVVPRSKDADAPGLDWGAAILALVAVAGVVFGIIEGPNLGWSDPAVIAALGAGAVATVLFVLYELRRDQPMLDPRLFRLRGFGTGSASITVQFLSFFGFIFIVMQYLQFVEGYSALGAAAAMLPFPIVMLPLARRAPAIASRLGNNRVGAVGLLLMAAGMVVFSFLAVELDYWVLAVGLVLLAAGLALSSTPATTAIVASLPARQQGVASAVNDTSRELGTALGIALLGSILNSGYSSGMSTAVAGLPSDVAAGAQDSIAYAQAAAAQLGTQGGTLAADAGAAFVEAMGNAVLVAAALLVIAAVYVAARAPRKGDPEGGEERAATVPTPPASEPSRGRRRSARA